MAAIVALCAVAANAQQTQEVVYLKNGSIVRGVIIEQIPNESLKIRTADGSLFVYSMSEVEKITKEEKTPVPSDASGGYGNADWNELKFDLAAGGFLGEDIYGLSFNYARGIHLSRTNGLTLRPGVGDAFYYEKLDNLWEIAFASLTPKLDLGYHITWPYSAVSIFPYIGLTTRINVWGRIYYQEHNHDNLFDNDFDDEESMEANRFQIGGRLGFDAHFRKFLLGLAYEQDFSEFIDGEKMWTINLKLGWCF